MNSRKTLPLVFSIRVIFLLSILNPYSSYSDERTLLNSENVRDYSVSHKMMTLSDLKRNREEVRAFIETSFSEEQRKSSRRTSFKKNASTILRPNVDLSKSPFFPGISNQGPLGSCVAWSGAYYVYSYEALKNRKIGLTKFGTLPPELGLRGALWEKEYGINKEDLGNRGACSVAYIHALASGGQDVGLSEMRVNYILSSLGCPTIAEVGPWGNIKEDGTFNPDFFPTIYHQISGISRRATGIRYFSHINDDWSETDPLYYYENKDVIQEIKQVLQAGFMVGGLTMATYTGFDSYNFAKSNCDSDGVYVFGRCLNQPIVNPLLKSLISRKPSSEEVRFRGFHAVTIVGYDDNKRYTVQQEVRKGAFKIANSWGKNFGPKSDPGFFWIPYDEFTKGKTVYNDVNEAKTWTPGSTESGFPDSTHSFISGSLFYITGINKKPITSLLQVTFKQQKNAEEEMHGVRFFSEIFNNKDSGNYSNFKFRKNFGDWTDGLFSFSPIIDDEDLGKPVMNDKSGTPSGPLILPEVERTLIQDVSDLLVDPQVSFPLTLTVTGKVANEFTHGTEILSASLIRRAKNGFLGLPTPLSIEEGDRNQLSLSINQSSDLPSKPISGTFCDGSSNTVTLWSCHTQKVTDWVEPQDQECYHRATSLKCDPPKYQEKNTFIQRSLGEINVLACKQEKPSPIGWSDTRRRNCYLGKTGFSLR